MLALIKPSLPELKDSILVYPVLSFNDYLTTPGGKTDEKVNLHNFRVRVVRRLDRSANDAVRQSDTDRDDRIKTEKQKIPR